MKVIDEDDYNEWNQEYDAAQLQLDEREAAVCFFFASMLYLSFLFSYLHALDIL